MANGIIQTKMPKNNTVAGYRPEDIEIGSKDTVAGQLDTITAENSPLMRRAASQGLQQANKRGLLNSSMAVESAQGAVLDRALPIASQDADTNFQSKALNQNAANTARQFTAGNVHERQLQSADIEGRSRLQKEMGNIESRLIKERGEIDKALLYADGQIRERLLNRQGQIDTQLQRLQGDQAMDLQRLQGGQAMDLQKMQGSQAVALQRLQGSQQISQIQAQGAQNMRLAVLDRSTQMELQNLRGEQAERLAKIEADNAMKIQGSQSATMLYSQTATNIGGILSDPNIPAAQKQSLVDKQLQLLDNGLSMTSKITNNPAMQNLLQFKKPAPKAPNKGLSKPKPGLVQTHPIRTPTRGSKVKLPDGRTVTLPRFSGVRPL